MTKRRRVLGSSAKTRDAKTPLQNDPGTNEEGQSMGLVSLGLGRWFHRDALPELGLAPPFGYQFPRGDRGLILIVDDSETVQAFLARMLRQAGYLTVAAGDGCSALHMIRHHKPDLVLMDLVMQETDGFAATRAIRNQPEFGDLPIIVMSGNQQATEQFWSQRIGADDFMAKPFSRTEVLTRIASLLPQYSLASGL
jgi:twitching motility two-component system response regulator PilH